jgi:hypothetical protein
MSPFIKSSSGNVSNLDFGVGFQFNAGTAAATGCRPDGTPYSIAAGTSLPLNGIPANDPSYQKTLVTSPTVTVCSACHDSTDAISHYRINGAAYYAPRSTALNATNETCLICHGTGRIADIAVMHSKNR